MLTLEGMQTEIYKMWVFDKMHQHFWHFVSLHAILCFNENKLKVSLSIYMMMIAFDDAVTEGHDGGCNDDDDPHGDMS